MRTIVFAAGLFGAILSYHLVAAHKEPPLHAGAIRPDEAESHLGEIVEVDGIAWVHEKRQATFLDLGGDYPNEALAVVIWPENRDQFGDLGALDGKPVSVSGEIRRYNGGFEIVAREKAQVQPL